MIRTVIVLVALLVLAIAYFTLRDGGTIIGTVTATEVKQLLTEPTQFDGRRVTVQGTVMDSAGVMGVGGYRLKQDDAEIYVVSGHGIPQPGAQVTVTGTFKQAFVIGALQYAVIVEQ